MLPEAARGLCRVGQLSKPEGTSDPPGPPGWSRTRGCGALPGWTEVTKDWKGRGPGGCSLPVPTDQPGPAEPSGVQPQPRRSPARVWCWRGAPARAGFEAWGADGPLARLTSGIVSADALPQGPGPPREAQSCQPRAEGHQQGERRRVQAKFFQYRRGNRGPGAGLALGRRRGRAAGRRGRGPPRRELARSPGCRPQLVKACNEGAHKMERTEQMYTLHTQLDFSKVKVGRPHGARRSSGPARLGPRTAPRGPGGDTLPAGAWGAPVPRPMAVGVRPDASRPVPGGRDPAVRPRRPRPGLSRLRPPVPAADLRLPLAAEARGALAGGRGRALPETRQPADVLPVPVQRRPGGHQEEEVGARLGGGQQPRPRGADPSRLGPQSWGRAAGAPPRPACPWPPGAAPCHAPRDLGWRLAPSHVALAPSCRPEPARPATGTRQLTAPVIWGEKLGAALGSVLRAAWPQLLRGPGWAAVARPPADARQRRAFSRRPQRGQLRGPGLRPGGPHPGPEGGGV